MLVGAGDATTNASLMEHIALTTNGAFYRAPDAAALDRALDDITAKLSR